MQLTTHIAKHLRDVHTGGNWTCSSLAQQLADVTWQESLKQLNGLNTIATLTFHINYFVAVALKVLEGGPLEGNDKFSFDHPPIRNEDDWKKLKEKSLDDAARLASLIEQLPGDKLWEDFTDPKYGNYYRNLSGIIEHTHYHLGQIAVIKKILRG